MTVTYSDKPTAQTGSLFVSTEPCVCLRSVLLYEPIRTPPVLSRQWWFIKIKHENDVFLKTCHIDVLFLSNFPFSFFIYCSTVNMLYCYPKYEVQSCFNVFS